MKNKLIRITTVPGSFGLLKGQLKFMSENGYNVIAISSSKTATIRNLEKVSQTEEVRVYPVEMSRTISIVKDLKAIWRLYFFLKKEMPFIVHTHTPKAGFVGMLAAFLARVPNRLHTVAGMPLLVVSGKKRKLLDIVEKITYACANKIYPNSFGLYDIILNNKYTSKNKLKVLNNGSSNGINVNYFDPQLISYQQKEELKSLLGIKPDNFIFIFIGRLVRDKGINELVSAFKKINIKYPKTKLLLLGSFERKLDPLLKQTEEEIENNQNIIHTGFQPDIRPYLSISDVFTFPSYREGFPNVVMQAGAMEIPSIVTNINGCNEIIVEGVNGTIIEVKNEDTLFIKMKLLMNNKNLLIQYKKNARNMIVSRYEQQKLWKEILAEYNNIIEKK